MAEAYKIGDLVWAKMKGFPPWPGKVSNPPKELKRSTTKKGAIHCIFFFGSNNYGWIEETGLKPYLDFKETLIKGNKSGGFKDAVEACEKFRLTKGEDFKEDTDTVFNRLVESVSPDKDKEKKFKPKLKKENPGKIMIKREYNRSDDSSPATKRKKKSLSLDSTLDATSNGDDSLENHSFRRTPGSNLLDRPANVTRPETPPLDLENVSQTLKEKNILPSRLKFGFLGLGIMGSGIVKNLLNSGHSVTVWNRTPEKVIKHILLCIYVVLNNVIENSTNISIFTCLLKIIPD
uniref:PWWP domain-containing protein n=1 Tax=Clastoptera arizonana TaxID=38151 RepID=A0A1B6CNC1_9HEMI